MILPFIRTVKSPDEDVLLNLAFFLMIMSNSTTPEQASTYISVAKAILGIVAKRKILLINTDKITVDVFTALQRIADEHPLLIPGICADGFLSTIIEMMMSEKELLYKMGVRCCSCILISDDASIIDRALLEGVVPALYKNLYRASSEVMKEALWGLSNLCCSRNKSHISYVLENEELVLRVI